MEYTFTNNQLEAQSISKVDLAFFYGVTPRQFRNEICDHITIRQGWKYSAEEVAKIFKFFGSIPTKADCERAQKSIMEYKNTEKMRALRYMNRQQ